LCRRARWLRRAPLRFQRSPVPGRRGGLPRGAAAKWRPPAGVPAAVMPRLGVLGWPVGHSRSPAIHNAAFAELAMAGWRYQRLPAELGARAVAQPAPTDVLVNCTSVGMPASATPPGPSQAPGALERSASGLSTLNQLSLTFDLVGEYAYVADLVYRAGSTELLA